MKFLINILIIALIFAYAGYRIYKVFQHGKKGKCAACDYDCEIKKQIKKHQN